MAGASKEALVRDFQKAVDKAVSKGITLQKFRKEFDMIVDKHKWSYKGTRNRRTKIIYNTNLRTSYAAGRYKQIQEGSKRRPFMRYVHSDSSVKPRETHKALHGTVLPINHPWWNTHYPPNGWGCGCTVRAESERSLERKGLKVTEKPPEGKKVTKTINGKKFTYEIDPRTGKPIIDPGWNYNVGEAAWGRKQAQRVMTSSGSGWGKPLTPTDIRPALPKPVPTKIVPGKVLKTVEEKKEAIEKILGGSKKTFVLKSDSGFRYPIHIDAEVFAKHIPIDRTRFIPFFKDLITNPQEAWMSFYRSQTTGKYALRVLLLKRYTGQTEKNMLAALNVQGGMLEAWTMYPQSISREPQRDGLLILGAKGEDVE